MHSDFSAPLLAADFSMRALWSNPAAAVDAPTTCILDSVLYSRRATAQRR